MLDFIKFMIKCLWHGSSYIFTGAPAVEPPEPFHGIGLIGWYIFVISFGISGWFVLKASKKQTLSYLEIFLSMLVSLIPVILYFIIAYCFV